MKKFFKPIVVWILTVEARLVLWRYRPQIIAVTGNMGKTSTKDAIYTALSDTLFVRKSEKSFNSEVGVPLTILGCESGWDNPIKWLTNILEGLALIFLKNHYPHWLVLEVGADRPGDIKRIAKWLKPDIAVVTGVPDIPVHVEYFESADAVAAEKRELAKALKPNGTLVLNGDNARSYAMRLEFRGPAVTVGFGEHNDVTASHEVFVYDDGKLTGMRFRVDWEGSSLPVEVRGAVGRAHAYPALAALATAHAAGIDFVSAGSALSEHVSPPGRMRVLEGVHGSTLIDDTYNSSPAATEIALNTLADIDAPGRKIAIVGDMLELGKHSAQAHRDMGELAARSVNMLVTVGVRARAIAEAAIAAGMPMTSVLQYDQGESEQAGQDIKSVIQSGDIVLVKGSQGMRMERTVKVLLADPSRAPELLVRQDPAWQNR